MTDAGTVPRVTGIPARNNWRTEYPDPDTDLREWCFSLPFHDRLDDCRVVDESETGACWAEPVYDPLPPANPTSHRSGTCFEVESTEMREACVEPLRAHLDAEVVVHEVRHQHSAYHTDLVYADVHDGLLDRVDMALGQKPLHDPLQRFRVWWYVHENGPMPLESAVEDGRYADPAKNRRHLEWLLDNGYLGRTSMGFVVAAVPPKIAELHAVELKLRDWKTALEQADRANRFDGFESWPPDWRLRYGYADYRWVALDAGAIGNALDHRDEFRDRGVGLVAVAEGGAVVEHIEPEFDPRRPYTRDRAYVESQVWNRIDLEDFGSELVEPVESGETAQPSLAAFDGGEKDGA